MPTYRYTDTLTAYFPDYGVWLNPDDTIELQSPPNSPWFAEVTTKPSKSASADPIPSASADPKE